MEHPASLTCCFTGHRTVPVGEKAQIEGALLKAIALLYTKGYRHFIAGGALGFDTMAANAVLSLKKRVKDITLTLILTIYLLAQQHYGEFTWTAFQSHAKYIQRFAKTNPCPQWPMVYI